MKIFEIANEETTKHLKFVRIYNVSTSRVQTSCDLQLAWFRNNEKWEYHCKNKYGSVSCMRLNIII